MEKLVAFVSFLAIVSLPSSLLAIQTGVADDDSVAEQILLRNEQISSICSAYLAHTAMLERGDVLISSKETFESINESNEYAELKITNSRNSRLIFDHPKKRFLWVDFYSFNKNLDASKSGAAPVQISNEYTRAIVYSDGECHARIFPRKGARYPDGPSKEYARLVKRYDVPDLRKIGLTPFNSLSLQPYEKFEGSVNSYANGSRLNKSKSMPEAKRQEVEFEIKDPNEEDFVTRLNITFNTEDFVPTRVKLDGYEVPEDNSKPRVGFIYSENITWSERGEFGETIVAKEVYSTIPKNFNVKQNSFDGRLNTKAKLHWQSVNQPIADEVFDFKCVYDLESLVDLVVLDETESQDTEDPDTKK